MARLRPVDLDFVRTAPRRYVNEAVVRAPRPRVFAALSGDPSGWKDWFPGLRSGRYDTEPGLGAVRVVSYQGMTFRETIVVWDEPSRWAFRVESSTVPLARALIEDWTFEEAGPDATLARWTFNVDPSLLGRVIAPLQMRTMSRIFARAMRNLDARLRS